MEKPLRIISRLASSLHRKDELPNQELAQEIAQSNNHTAVAELIENLSNTQAIQYDCIKVLYEIGRITPVLIIGHLDTFVKLLDSKNNRMQWGAMIALGTITHLSPAAVYQALPKILLASDKGSVITKDHAYNILLELAKIKEWEPDVVPLILEQLIKCPTNQLPAYAEKAVDVIHENNRSAFDKVLTARLGDVVQDSKKKRVEKVLRKLPKG